jgi:hypothetical protein
MNMKKKCNSISLSAALSRFRWMVLLMGSVLLSTSLQADEPRASSAVVQPIKIACVGDSITLGVGIPSPETNSYPAQLQKMLGEEFEVPPHQKTESFTMKIPWADEADRPAITLTAGRAHTFQLEPFQVLVLERK